MGSTFTIPEDVKQNPPNKKPTREMNLNVDDMYSIISYLTQISDTLYVGSVSKEKKRQLEYIFPEFMFLESGPGNLTKVIRSRYNNDVNVCCKSFSLTSYWKNNDDISLLYKPNFILNSCDPDLKTSGYCDNTLFEWCQTNKYDKNVCNDWMKSLFIRRDGDLVVNKFISMCSNYVNTDICKDFLHTLRVQNTETTDNIIDYILYQQSDDFKNNFMKCSFPSEDKINESLKSLEPRECWDPECENANVNFLLTENYNNLGLCTINRCNVSINHLDVDSVSSVHMSCNGNNLISPSPVNREKVILDNINSSFNLKINLITILSLLIIWILIVAI
ncbi:59R [Yaba monkey tumor virus]|uniref:59R n=1 Tax=Yaba monkey tumor virus (strain VR587) TaxID=928314 RepID=Q6TUV4_YMTV5|nr:poxvirus myristoylprotein [Yaba monkey tumor virus]AAR07415.1 59R [Yaba monkey tumor virus]